MRPETSPRPGMPASTVASCAPSASSPALWSGVGGGEIGLCFFIITISVSKFAFQHVFKTNRATLEIQVC